jgi:hypothetical protein
VSAGKPVGNDHIGRNEVPHRDAMVSDVMKALGL